MTRTLVLWRHLLADPDLPCDSMLGIASLLIVAVNALAIIALIGGQP